MLRFKRPSRAVVILFAVPAMGEVDQSLQTMLKKMLRSQTLAYR